MISPKTKVVQKDCQLANNDSALIGPKTVIHLNDTLSLPDLLQEQISVKTRKVILLKCGIVRLTKGRLRLRVGDQLRLVHNSGKSNNKWLTFIETQTGYSLGQLPINKDQSVARLIDAGKCIKAVVIDPADPQIKAIKAKSDETESFQIAIAVYMEIREETKL